uniref:Uncharacterized protein n=1 Tax=Arundo donax TaxID=35708 RepID=A0A0A9F238_ARUDO
MSVTTPDLGGTSGSWSVLPWCWARTW